MACIDKYPDKQSQDYKKCIKKTAGQNEFNAFNRLGILDIDSEEALKNTNKELGIYQEEPKVSPTAVEFEKEKEESNTLALQQIINRNRASAGLEPQNNIDTPYDPEKDKNQLTTTTITKDITAISKKEFDKRANAEAERQAIANGSKKLTFKESIKNSASNFLLQLQGVDDRAKWLWAYAGRLDAQMGYGGPGAEEKWTKMMAESEAEQQRLESQNKSTIGFTDLGGEDTTFGENVLGGAAATINAISSFGASAVTSVATAGIGLASDMISGSVRDFNNQKAEELGITTDELISSGQSEIMTPAIIGGVGFALEKAGIKGVTSAINAMAIGPKRALIKILNASGKEGGTEWLQTGLDEMNSLIAKGMSATVEGEVKDKGGNLIKTQVPNPELINLVWKKMGSKEGIESLLQGAVGGGASAGGGRSIKTIRRLNGQANIRSSQDNAAITSLVSEISIADEALSNPQLSPEDRKTFEDFNKAKKAELNTVKRKSVDLVNELDDAQVETLNKNSEIITETLNDIKKIDDNETFTVNERSVLVTALKQKSKVAQQNVYDITNEAELKLKKKNTPRKLTPEQEKINKQLDEISKQAEANVVAAAEAETKKENKLSPKAKKKQDEINSLVGEINDDGSYNVSKTEWDSGKADIVIADIYSNNILTGLIESKIPIETPPGFSKEDFVQSTVVELIPHIRNFNPEANNSLSGWINSQLNNKVGNVFKKGDAATKGKFEVDVTEQRAVIDNDASTIEDIIDLKAIEKKETVKAADKLRDITGITTAETVAEGEKILGGKIRTEAVKGNKNPARSDIAKAGKIVFADKIIESFGGVLGSKDNKLGNYITALENQGQDILDVMSDQSTIKNNILNDLYKPKKIDREKTPEGNAVMEYENPNPKVEDLIAWAMDPNLAPTTLINRQRTLANLLGGLLGRASTVESIKTPKGKKEFITKQEIQGKKLAPDAVEKLIIDIDVRIADAQKIVNDYKGTLSSGFTPGSAAQAFIIFAKGFKKILKTTNNIKKALEQGFKDLKKFLIKTASPAEADVIIDEIKQDVGEITKVDDKTLNDIKDSLTEALENYDKTKDNARFKSEVKKLITKFPGLNLKNALIDSKIYYQKTKNSPSRIDTKIADKLVKDAITYVEALPIETHNALGIKGKPYTDIAGTHKRNFDIANKKADGKPGRYNTKFDKNNLNLKTADELIADGTWSAETAAIWNTLDMSKVQPLNSKSTASSPLLKDIKNILAGKTKAQTVVEKKAAIDKVYDSEVGVNNLKFAELNVNILKDGYKSGKISLPYLLNALQAQSNVTAGFRALTSIGGLEIVAGKVDLTNFKGEHLQSNSQTMSEILEWIITPNSNNLELQGILAGHNQVFGDKTKLFDPIDKTFSTTSKLGAERLTRGLNRKIAESIYVPFSKTDFLTQTAHNEYKKQVQELGKKAKEVSKVLDDGEKFKDSKKGQKIIEKNKEIESQDLSKGFNDIIETNKGLPSQAKYSEIIAKRKGSKKGKYRFFVPPGAEDFKGLLYNFLGKGKVGETQMKWFQNKLIDPYNKGVAQIERYRRALKNDYSTLLKQSPNVRKQLGKKIKGADFTYDNAIRAYLWNKDGVEIPGLSKRDTKTLVNAIQNNPEMRVFAEGLQLISKQPTWLKPTASWDVQSITSDLHNFTSTDGRKQYLGEFIDNSNEIFSKDNLNKIEGEYGTNLKEALQDALYRMETGINRSSGTNRLTNNFNNWVNRSIGAIMFFNRKSALLQTLSSVNFVNWSDNNPVKAAAAFANQKQYWSDVVKIFNSPKLKQRRAGLKGDVNESELANAAATATNKAEAALSYLLKIGFTPTQLADSFAIATGGATFLRNRINTYKNQNMSEVEAENQAWKDFSAISEETQQSADPSLISQQQASPLGRLILAFQNTPMQYTRLMKKAGQDLINGRGDAKTHISKIIYYGAIQNFIFAALQNALFAAIPGFGGEDEEEDETKREKLKENKSLRILNNMTDTILRGSGIYGAIAATIKNTVLKYFENEKKDPFAKDNSSILLEAVNLSPPIGSKLRKLNNALKTKEFEKDVISERGWEMTRNGKVNLSPSYRVLGSTLEATLNIPLERALAEIDALIEMTDQRNSAMERIALGLGWRTWDVGVRNEEHDQIKVEAKERKKQVRKDKVIKDREEKKRLAELKRFEGKTEKEIKLIKQKDSIIDTNKSDQIKSLTNLGLTKKEIKSLKYEDDRVNKIIELQNKK